MSTLHKYPTHVRLISGFSQWLLCYAATLASEHASYWSETLSHFAPCAPCEHSSDGAQCRFSSIIASPPPARAPDPAPTTVPLPSLSHRASLDPALCLCYSDPSVIRRDERRGHCAISARSQIEVSGTAQRRQREQSTESHTPASPAHSALTRALCLCCCLRCTGMPTFVNPPRSPCVATCIVPLPSSQPRVSYAT